MKRGKELTTKIIERIDINCSNLYSCSDIPNMSIAKQFCIDSPLQLFGKPEQLENAQGAIQL